MRKNLFRLENLLLMVPLLVFCADIIIFGNRLVDIHLYDTYFVLSNTFVFALVFVCMITLYLLHFCLRVLQKRKVVISRIHVYGSLICQVLIFLLLHQMSFSPGIARQYDDASSPKQFSAFNETLGYLFFIYALLQLLFFIYFLATILVRKKSHSSN